MAELLGIDPNLLEYGIAGIAIAALVLVLRMWNSERSETRKQDERQTGLEKTLAELAASAVAESSLTRKAYEKNNEVLARNNAAIDKNAEVMANMAKVLQTMMTAVGNVSDTVKKHNERVQILETSLNSRLDQLAGQLEGVVVMVKKPIKIIVKKQDGTLLYELVAEEVDDNGTDIVVTLTEPEKKEEAKEDE